MAVNMTYVPKAESRTKVLKTTPPLNGSSDSALTSEKQQPLWSVFVFVKVAFSSGH